MTETRFGFKWRWPRLDTYRAADHRRLGVGLNRYPGAVIGAYVQMGRRVLGLRWGRPEAARDRAAGGVR